MDFTILYRVATLQGGRRAGLAAAAKGSQRHPCGRGVAWMAWMAWCGAGCYAYIYIYIYILYTLIYIICISYIYIYIIMYMYV